MLSLTNHSCNPVAARFTFGGTVALTAVRFISAGTEITDCYGEHFCISRVEARTASLLQQYYFKCSCEACQHHWPTYFELSDECKLICMKCNRPIDCCRGKCPKCSLDYTKTSRTETLNVVTYNWKDIMEQYKHIKTEYEGAYKSIISGKNSSENISKICKFIEFMDKYVQQPCRLYCEAQETLKHCFNRQASFCQVLL